MDNNGNALLPAFFTFDSSALSLYIFTDDPANIHDYQLKIQGTITGYATTATSLVFEVRIVSNCDTYIVTPPSEYTAVDYVIT